MLSMVGASEYQGLVLPRPSKLGFMVYLEGKGDLVSGLIPPIRHIMALLIPFVNLLTRSP